MRKEKKRGLSPVIATVLLISVALVLAVIIFFWAKSFIGENIQKDGQKIEEVCEAVAFNAEAIRSTNELLIVNTGSIPIHKIEVNVIGAGEIKSIPSFEGDISPGETATLGLDSSARIGDKLILVPILLGESATNRDYVAKICDEDYGVEIQVK